MDKIYESKISLKWGMEAPGIDPGTSRMLSERSTIWATPPLLYAKLQFCLLTLSNKVITTNSSQLPYL